MDAGTRSLAAQLSQARARAHGTRKSHCTQARLAACKTLEIIEKHTLLCLELALHICYLSRNSNATSRRHHVAAARAMARRRRASESPGAFALSVTYSNSTA